MTCVRFLRALALPLALFTASSLGTAICATSRADENGSPHWDAILERVQKDKQKLRVTLVEQKEAEDRAHGSVAGYVSSILTLASDQVTSYRREKADSIRLAQSAREALAQIKVHMGKRSSIPNDPAAREKYLYLLEREICDAEAQMQLAENDWTAYTSKQELPDELIRKRDAVGICHSSIAPTTPLSPTVLAPMSSTLDQLSSDANPPQPLPARVKPKHLAHTANPDYLVLQAQRVLENVKAGKPDGLDLAQFLIDAETASTNADKGGLMAQEELDQVRALWTEKEKSYRALVARTPGTKERKTRTLMQALHRDFLARYCREEPKLTDFLGKAQCANCVGETLLEVSALRATGLIPEPPSRLTVQVFADHVQAILYTPGAKGKPARLWNLLTGLTTNTIEAPLFDDHILIQGYLNAQKKPSPLSDSSFLVTEMDAKLKKPGEDYYAQRSAAGILLLPGSSTRFTTDGIPRFTMLAPPAMSEKSGIRLAARSSEQNQNSANGTEEEESGPLAKTLIEADQKLKQLSLLPTVKILNELITDPRKIANYSFSDLDQILKTERNISRQFASVYRFSKKNATQVKMENELANKNPSAAFVYHASAKLHRADQTESFLRICEALGPTKCWAFEALSSDGYSGFSPSMYAEILSSKENAIYPSFGYTIPAHSTDGPSVKEVKSVEGPLIIQPWLFRRALLEGTSHQVGATDWSEPQKRSDLAKVLKYWTPDATASLRMDKTALIEGDQAHFILRHYDLIINERAQQRPSPSSFHGLHGEGVPQDIAQLLLFVLKKNQEAGETDTFTADQINKPLIGNAPVTYPPFPPDQVTPTIQRLEAELRAKNIPLDF